MALDFEHEPNGFDLDNAYFFARACEAATLNSRDERLSRAAEHFGLQHGKMAAFDLTDPEDHTDYHGLVGSSAELTLLAFRDVANPHVWFSDALVEQKPAFGGMVHTGFSDALANVWDAIEPVITNRPRDLPVWITGHGIGGALAILAAARFEESGTPVRAVYTFGAPRVGNTDFYHSYPVCNYRLVHNNDIFSHAPAESFPVGGFHYVNYKHTGTLVYLDRHGNIGEGTTNWTRKKELVQERLVRLGQPPTDWFQDHHLSSYLNAIERNL